ncbi:MAG: N-acetylmuramoyl-L-alanine amidase [Oscillospiraceae bacterium]|nr:N-acetylmuramoyl-L-alanine amidase [Oscillospiraceae bacterium]
MRNRRLSFLVPIYLLILCILLLTGIFGSRAITAISENSKIDNRQCVIIDAGHGGVDGGATSCSGFLESNINLEIAIKLNDLMHLLGIDTLMIRQSDISIYTEGESIAAKKVSDLKQRVKLVNNTQRGLLISIHQNYFSDSRYKGAQVFYAPTDGSKEFAIAVQNDFKKSLNPESNRQAKKADGIYLMQHINCTGILVECGFISNPQEDWLLRNNAYQNKICCVLASAASQYLHNRLIS